MPKTDIEVKLIGNDGNAFAILAEVRNALRSADLYDLAEEYMNEATNGDYSHLLCVTNDYVEVV